MRKKKYRFFNYHLISCTLFVLVVSALLTVAFEEFNADFFNPVKVALQDLEITDQAFKKDSADFKAHQKVRTDIVLVNIGNLDRSMLAEELNRINSFEPAVVGIDAFFIREKAPELDFPLAMALQNTKNLVLVSRLDTASFDPEKERFGNVIHSNPKFSATAYSGFANLITGNEHGLLTTRTITPYEFVHDTVEWSFPAKIVQLYDPQAFERLKSRPRQPEIINFSGNLDRFLRVDADQVLDTTFDLSVLKGKIVLMGFLGERMGEPSLTDIFFTPLNPNIAGRSIPDMYGIVVHANILNMMLEGNFIEQSPQWLDIAIGVMLCLVNCGIFLFVSRRMRNISQVSMRTLQILQAAILTALSLYLMANEDYKFHLGITIGLIFLTGDLTEVYQNVAFNWVEKAKGKRIRQKINKRKKERETTKPLPKPTPAEEVV